MYQGYSAHAAVRGVVASSRWVVEHFDVVAATWLIILAIAWAFLLASLSATSPSNWNGPLIGGRDWNATLVSPAPDAPLAGSSAHR